MLRFCEMWDEKSCKDDLQLFFGWGCLKSLLLLIRDICGEKLSPSICHCEEQSDVAIFNFIDQKVSFWILTIRYNSYKCYRSPRHFIPRDDRVKGFIFSLSVFLLESLDLQSSLYCNLIHEISILRQPPRVSCLTLLFSKINPKFENINFVILNLWKFYWNREIIFEKNL